MHVEDARIGSSDASLVRKLVKQNFLIAQRRGRHTLTARISSLEQTDKHTYTRFGFWGATLPGGAPLRTPSMRRVGCMSHAPGENFPGVLLGLSLQAGWPVSICKPIILPLGPLAAEGSHYGAANAEVRLCMEGGKTIVESATPHH